MEGRILQGYWQNLYYGRLSILVLIQILVLISVSKSIYMPNSGVYMKNLGCSRISALMNLELWEVYP